MENKLLKLLHNTVPLSNTVFSGGIMSFFIYFVNDVLKDSKSTHIDTTNSTILIDGEKTDPKTVQDICICLCVMNFLISIANVFYSKLMKTEHNKTSDEKKELLIQNSTLSDQISRLSNFSSDGKSSNHSVDMEMDNKNGKEPYN